MKGDKFIHTQVALRDRPLVKTVFRISYGRSLNTSLTVISYCSKKSPNRKHYTAPHKTLLP